MVRCGPMSYYDQSLAQCEPCHPSCHSCSGPADTQCGACNKDLIYFERRCVSYCPAGYSQSVDQSECVRCPTGCDACTEHVGQCSNCSLGWERTGEGLCEFSSNSQCQPGLYHSSGSCLACHTDCRTCSGPSDTHCTSCYSDHKQHLSSCLQHCDTGKHEQS